MSRRQDTHTDRAAQRKPPSRYRWADNQIDRLPALAAEFVRRQVAVIVTSGGANAASAAKCPIPKTTRKAPSGVRTFSPATNGIAAFAVTASCIRRWYASTLLMITTKLCHQACMSTSRAQFGSERNSHRRLRAASSQRRRLRRLLRDSEQFRSAPRTCRPSCGRLEVRKTVRTGRLAGYSA
jgi:hypothetical protein